MPELTKEEKNHINSGGRVFWVDEIDEGKWGVFCLSQEGRHLSLSGYSDPAHALDIAFWIARLSSDKPMVRRVSEMASETL